MQTTKNSKKQKQLPLPGNEPQVLDPPHLKDILRMDIDRLIKQIEVDRVKIQKELQQIDSDMKRMEAFIKSVTEEVKSGIQFAEVQVFYKRSTSRTKITSSRTSEIVFRTIWDKNSISVVEKFYVLFLNRANQLLCWKCISSGGITSTTVDPMILFSIATQCLAKSIIVAHNHPSGNLLPGKQDLDVTKQIKQAGALLDVTLTDHIIITEDSYYSFADEKML